MGFTDNQQPQCFRTKLTKNSSIDSAPNRKGLPCDKPLQTKKTKTVLIHCNLIGVSESRSAGVGHRNRIAERVIGVKEIPRGNFNIEFIA